MTKAKKIVVACFVAVTVLIMIFMIIDEAQASKYESDTTTINNYYPASMTIIEGVSDEDLAAGLAAAFANSHQFDFGTYDWQGSIVGAYESSEDENAVSFGVGKRFKKLDALIHTSFTQSGDTEYYIVGGTFRF